MTEFLPVLLQAVCKDNGFFSYPIPSWFSTTKHIRPLIQRLCSLDGLLCSKTHLHQSTVMQLSGDTFENTQVMAITLHLIIKY